MNFWLVKSEPGAWSWDDQLRERVTAWTGVRNHQAGNYLKAMKLGDRAFFYHSVDERRILGIVEVVAEARPDPTADDPRWMCPDLGAVAALAQPVSLARIKAEPRLAGMALLRQSRLSVQPVSAGEWEIILAMGGGAP